MRVIKRKTLIEYYRSNPAAKVALEDWYSKTDTAQWESFADVKRTFRTADYVGNNRIVFNIKGNDFRLVCLVLFKARLVFIRFVGTHSEYERIENIKTI